jgi:hypothetical protein
MGLGSASKGNARLRRFLRRVDVDGVETVEAIWPRHSAKRWASSQEIETAPGCQRGPPVARCWLGKSVAHELSGMAWQVAPRGFRWAV